MHICLYRLPETSYKHLFNLFKIYFWRIPMKTLHNFSELLKGNWVKDLGCPILQRI